MIYCLLNNTYHITDFQSMFDGVVDEEVFFIIVPVNLDVTLVADRTRLELPSISIKNMRQSFLDLRVIKKDLDLLSKKLTDHDSLLVFSEINITNQIVIEHFYNEGVKLWLVEDGMASPTLFNSDWSANSFVTSMISLYLKVRFSLKDTTICRVASAYFYFSPDHYFKGYIQSINYKINRNIRQYKLEIIKKRSFLDSNESSVVFFNQPLYLFYCSEKKFYLALSDIIKKLAATYTEVYFKLHPSETKEHIVTVNKICQNLSNVTILSKDLQRDDFIHLNVSQGISFISTALKEYEAYGLVPIYIYHLYPNLIPDSISSKINDYLLSMGYKFINNLEELVRIKKIREPREMYNHKTVKEIDQFKKEMLYAK